MKRLFIAAFLMLCFTTYGQTYVDLSNMTDDVILGQNCSSSQEPQQFVTDDVNLNGFEVELRNSTLTVNGDINGEGEIEGCGQSQLCINGTTGDEVEIEDDLSCSTLSMQSYNQELNFTITNNWLTVKDVDYINLYEISGKKVISAKGNSIDLSIVDTGVYVIQTSRGNKKLLIKQQ